MTYYVAIKRYGRNPWDTSLDKFTVDASTALIAAMKAADIKVPGGEDPLQYIERTSLNVDYEIPHRVGFAYEEFSVGAGRTKEEAMAMLTQVDTPGDDDDEWEELEDAS